MQVRVTLHGWLKVGVDDPDGLIELTLPDGTDVAAVIEALRETSPMHARPASLPRHGRWCNGAVGSDLERRRRSGTLPYLQRRVRSVPNQPLAAIKVGLESFTEGLMARG
jgi:hypothetical protein